MKIGEKYNRNSARVFCNSQKHCSWQLLTNERHNCLGQVPQNQPGSRPTKLLGEQL